MNLYSKHETKMVILFSIITFLALYYRSYGFSLNADSLVFIVIYLIMLGLYIKYNKKS